MPGPFVDITPANERTSYNLVWDTGTLQWVKETQPSGGGGGGAITVADGADVALGATTDAAVFGDNPGTLSAKSRGLNKYFSGTTVSGTLTNNGDTLVIDTHGMGGLSIWQPGFVGGFDGTILLEGSNDGGVNWFGIKTARQDDGQIINSFNNTSFVIRVNVAGLTQFRLHVTNRTVGNTTCTMYADIPEFDSFSTASLFDQGSGNHATIDNHGSLNTRMKDDAGNTLGIATAPVRVDPTGTTTQPVSAASLPLPSGAATAANQTNKTQETRVTDGTNDATVRAGSSLPAATDTALVVTQRDALPAGSNVIGHVITDTGSVTDVTDRAARLLGHVVVDSGGGSSPPATSTTTRVSPIWRQSVQLLAANAARKEGQIVNNTDAPFFLKEGVGASDVSYATVVPPRAKYLFDVAVEIDGFWNQLPTRGEVLVTERV